MQKRESRISYSLVIWTLGAFKKQGFVFLAFLMAGSSLNCLVWLRYWASPGLVLCQADAYMTCSQPSFSFMLLVPLCLFVLARFTRYIGAPSVVQAFPSRSSFGMALIVFVIVLAGSASFAVACVAGLTGRLSGLAAIPFNWGERESFFWHSTGLRYQGELTVHSVGFLVFVSCFSLLCVYCLVFLCLLFTARSPGTGQRLAWGLSLGSAWILSFPVSPTLYRIQSFLSLSMRKLQGPGLPLYYLASAGLLAAMCLLLKHCISKKDFLS